MFSWNEKGGTNNWGLLVGGPPQKSVPQFIEADTIGEGPGLSNPLVIPVPSSRQPGDVLIAASGCDRTTTSTNWTAGWTKLQDSNDASNECTLSLFWKISDGTETSFQFDQTEIRQHGSGCAVFRGVDLDESLEESTEAQGTSNPVCDAPSFSPSWGTANVLWVAVGAHDSGSLSGVSAPTNYELAFHQVGGEVFGGGSMMAYRAEFDATTENPDGFPASFSTEWTCYLIALKGKSGASANSTLRISESGIIDPRVDPDFVRITEDGQYRFTE